MQVSARRSRIICGWDFLAATCSTSGQSWAHHNEKSPSLGLSPTYTRLTDREKYRCASRTSGDRSARPASESLAAADPGPITARSVRCESGEQKSEMPLVAQESVRVDVRG